MRLLHDVDRFYFFVVGQQRLPGLLETVMNNILFNSGRNFAPRAPRLFAPVNSDSPSWHGEPEVLEQHVEPTWLPAVGDLCRVTKNIMAHGFNIYDVVEVLSIEDRYLFCAKDNSEHWISITEIEPYVAEAIR